MTIEELDKTIVDGKGFHCFYNTYYGLSCGSTTKGYLVNIPDIKSDSWLRCLCNSHLDYYIKVNGMKIELTELAPQDLFYLRVTRNL